MMTMCGSQLMRIEQEFPSFLILVSLSVGSWERRWVSSCFSDSYSGTLSNHHDIDDEWRIYLYFKHVSLCIHQECVIRTRLGQVIRCQCMSSEMNIKLLTSYFSLCAISISFTVDIKGQYGKRLFYPHKNQAMSERH